MSHRFVIACVSAGTLVCLPGLAAAQEQPGIVVMPLRSTTVEANVRDALGELLVSMVGELERYRVVSPQDVEAMLGLEQLKDSAGCDDVACAADLAGALGARYVLASTLNAYGSTLVLTSTLLDSQQAEAIGRANIKARNDPDAYYDAVRQLVGKTFEGETDRKLTFSGRSASHDDLVACLDGNAKACEFLEASDIELAAAAAEACTSGAQDVCTAMAKSKDEQAARRLFSSCDQGVQQACVALRDTGKMWERGRTFRVAAYVLWGVGAVTASVGIPLSLALIYPNSEFNGIMCAMLAGAPLVVGSVFFPIGYLRAIGIKKRAGQPQQVTLAPTVFPRPDGTSIPGLAFGLQF